MNKQQKKLLDKERVQILAKWDRWFEIPLIILGFCWLVLIILELTTGLSPLLETLSFTIWIIFILDFVVRFSLAPFKFQYLKSNWVTLIALAVPAFRIFRGIQLLRAARGIHLIKIASSIRRGMQILGSIFGRHGFGYIIGLTFIIILLGAAGIQALEGKFKSYGDALWWAAMMMTTMGTDFWPETIEGRILCLGLAIYAFAIFGYITATVASFLIGKDQEHKNENKKILEAIEALKQEIKSLKKNH
jgi:voltage-gated potassium channel